MAGTAMVIYATYMYGTATSPAVPKHSPLPTSESDRSRDAEDDSATSSTSIRMSHLGSDNDEDKHN
ncbi:hypothetical protein LPJ59_005451, partial [Coemansia sp. RSA 2399]